MNIACRLSLHRWHLVAAALALLAAGLAQAQPAAGDIDPPGRVGRIADTFGQTWLYSPDSGEWVDAARNRPVTTGDHLATDPGARAEVAVGSTTVRLDGGTEIEVSRLDDEAVVLQLHAGAVALRVHDARGVGELEVTTPEGRIRVQTAGRYRIDRGDRATELTIDAGQAQWEGPGNGLTLFAGQRGQFWIENNGVGQYAIVEPLRDEFAAWNAQRDRAFDRVPVARYVSPEMTGAEDLDRYGRWEQSPEYGPIWYPVAVPATWAPYTAGHWAWVPPWGWTWVDDTPWGFAPFHYGRWVYYRARWCWVPGRYVARPVYAPALVAWVGGPQVGVSLTIGGGPAVGWVPLAPREVYVPAFRAAPRYVREVNVTHVTNVTQITTIINNPPRQYANWHAPHAVTVVPASVIERREAVAPHAERSRELPAVRAFVQAPPARPIAMLAPPVATPPAAHGPSARAPAPPGVGNEHREEGRRTIPERPHEAPSVGARPTAPAVRPAEASPIRPAEAPPGARVNEAATPPAVDGRRTIPRPPGGEDRMGRERREAMSPSGPEPTAPARVAPAVAPPPAATRPVPPAPVSRAQEAPRAMPAERETAPPRSHAGPRSPEGAQAAEAPRARPPQAVKPAEPARVRPAEGAKPAEAQRPHPPEGGHPPAEPQAAKQEPRDDKERNAAQR
ncbi:MAG TPA: DUF6600 domain-containing protein [Caldimonas sp.]|nr:DUF6600 domain-containing protein [Caldimonas sp.]